MREVVGPWLEDRSIEMGDREWRPARSQPEDPRGPADGPAGPRLRPGMVERRAQLGERHPAGPRARRRRPALAGRVRGRDRARRRALAADVVAGHGGRAIPWSEAQERLDRRDPEIAAVILVTRTRPASVSRAEAERDAARNDQHRVGGRLDRVVAGGAERRPCPAGASGREPTTSRSTGPPLELGDARRRAPRRGSRPSPGRLGSPSSMMPTVLTLTDGCSSAARPGRRRSPPGRRAAVCGPRCRA